MTEKNTKITIEFEPNWLENRVCIALGRVLMTRYNWSLILIAILIWSFGGSLFPYSGNANFDMLSSMNEYFRYMSVFSIAVGLFFATQRAHILVGLGIANYLLGLASIMMSKVLLLNGLSGVFLLHPLNIFCFLLILKNIWILAVDKAVNESARG
jgi:hypothetical protein